MNPPRRAISVSVAAAALALGAAAPALANGITYGDAFNFRDDRSANSVGLGVGDFLTFGLNDVLPSGDDNHDGFADSDGTSPPSTVTGTVTGTGVGDVSLGFFPTTVTPNHFVRSLPWKSLGLGVKKGNWTYTITNGTDTATATTSNLAAVGATRLPFVTDMSVMVDPTKKTTPTLTWTNPTATDADVTRIAVWDLGDFLGQGQVGVNKGGVANVIYSKALTAGQNSFTIPDSAGLQSDHLYSVSIQSDALRNESGSDVFPNLLSRSRAFFDLSTGPLVTPVGATGPVYLPTVDPAGSAAGAPVYHFDVGLTGDPVLIDPEVAVGYDYKVGAGDPNFASVTLPKVGDGNYVLTLFDSNDNPFSMALDHDVTFDFTKGLQALGLDIPDGQGVSRFRVTGIAPSQGLDPHDPQAFVTQLTFVGNDGRFTGTMTAITRSVPEPATLLVFGTGLVVLAAGRRRRRRRTA